jgi:chemotaxis protein CheD
VLGSCIAVCMRDPITGYGGMNHFLLPQSRTSENDLPDNKMRYGAYSIERLTNSLIARGASRESIEVKVFGGANILKSGSNVGHANADFVEQYLKRERLNIVSKSLRGFGARRVRYYPSTGRAQVCETDQETIKTLAWREAQLSAHLQQLRVEGKVELFDAPKHKHSG